MLAARSNSHITRKGPIRVIAYITLWSFLFSIGPNDLLISKAWAARTPLELTSSGSNRPGSSPAFVKELDVETFNLPHSLGHVKDIWKGKSDNTVIHIQDAHCNYYAQHAINKILEYIDGEYDIDVVNLEGGVGNYNISLFTDIHNRYIREKVSDYFVKEGLVNGAEYFAINNPQKVHLWGMEDTKLYLEGLNIYRDSLRHNEVVDEYLKGLNHIINNLKRHIYSRELSEFDEKYAQYKIEEIDFKDYLAYLIQKAYSKEIKITPFANIHLLQQSLKQEEKIDFKRANEERKNLIGRFEDLFSKKEFKEIALKAIDFKADQVSQARFYKYVVERAESIRIDLKEYPELEKYIAYITAYETVDKFGIMEEIGLLEEEIKNSLYKNDTQRELSILSKNLTLLNNIFGFSLTPDDYRYYKDNKDSFNTKNYVSFINKQGPLYHITATLDKNIDMLDRHRETIDKFYKCAFARDNAFIRNIKFAHDRLRLFNRKPRVTVLITGGFHSESLSRLFKESDTSYISILPTFKIEDGYECPYFNILFGKMSPFEKSISTALSLMQVASFLNGLGIKANDPRRTELIRIRAIALQSMYSTTVPQGFKLTNGKYAIFERGDEGPTCYVSDTPGNAVILAENVIPGNANSIIHAFSEIAQDRIIREAKDRTYLNNDSEVIVEARRMLDSMPGGVERDTLSTALDDFLERDSYTDEAGKIQSPEGYSAVQIIGDLLTYHPGGQGIYLPKMDEEGRLLSAREQAIMIIHELVAETYAGSNDRLLDSHQLAEAVENAFRSNIPEQALRLLASARAYHKRISDMTPEERLEIDRDVAMAAENVRIIPWNEIRKRIETAQKAVSNRNILVGFMRTEEGIIQPYFSDSPEFRSIRESRGGFFGSIAMMTGWNPLRRVQIVPLSVKRTSFSEPKVDRTENWQFLPREIRDIFEQSNYLVTTQKQEGPYSIFMYMTPTDEKSRKGRSGILLKDGLPVVLEINGKEFLIELKGSGLVDGGYETTNGALAGGVTEEFSKREILNLDSRKDSVNYREGETSRGAAHVLIHPSQGYVVRLTPGSFRLSYSQNIALPRVESQKASFIVGREITALLAEGRVPFTHPENFILINNGENLSITDYSDILRISDLPGNVEDQFFSPLDAIVHALGTIEEISGYKEDQDSCFDSFLKGVVEGCGKVMSLSLDQIQDILNVKDFRSLADILWRQFLFRQYFELRKERGWIPYGLREEIFDAISGYKKTSLDSNSGFPLGFLKAVETKMAAKGETADDLARVLQKTDLAGISIITASREETILADALADEPIGSQGRELLYRLKGHLLSEIELLQGSLDFIVEDELRREVEYNLIIAIRKFLVLEDMSSVQILQEISENRDFVVSMYMLPYYSNMTTSTEGIYRGWISTMATQAPQKINLGFSPTSCDISSDIPPPLTMDDVQQLWETPEGLQRYKQALYTNEALLEKCLTKMRELKDGTSEAYWTLVNGIGYLKIK
jgi:hypothetical protein